MNYVQLLKNTPATPYQRPLVNKTETDDGTIADFQFVMTNSQYENKSQQDLEKHEALLEHNPVVDESNEAGLATPLIFEKIEHETRIGSEEVLPDSFVHISDRMSIPIDLMEEIRKREITDIADELFELADVEQGKLNTNQLQYEQLDELVIEINQVLTQSLTGENATNNISKLLDVLQEWTSLQHSDLESNTKLKEKIPDNLMKIWEEMVDIYRKRDLMAKNKIYQTDSAITKTDIMNWLQNALERHMPNQESININMQITSNQPLPLSVPQQHTIYLNNLDRVEAISYELVNRLEKVIRNSNFMHQNGLQQLTITLKPETLGDITVRMIQVNGEMTVKLMVTTQVAKGLLEGNIQQLKPMFAPHQIVIERDAGISDEEFYQGEQEQADEEQHDSLKDADEGQQMETEDVSFMEILSVISEEAVANDND